MRSATLRLAFICCLLGMVRSWDAGERDGTATRPRILGVTIGIGGAFTSGTFDSPDGPGALPVATGIGAYCRNRTEDPHPITDMRLKTTGLIAATLVVTATLAAVPGAGAAATAYLEETYGSSPTTWTSSWFDADIGARNRVSAISDSPGGTGIKVSIPASSHYGSAMQWRFDDNGMAEPDELYFRYFLRVPDNFTNYGRGKLPGPAGLYSASAKNNIKPTDSNPGWSARMFFSPTYDARDGDYTQLGYYVYHRDQAEDQGDLDLWDTQTGTLRHGSWYCVEGHVAMNTPGVADGLLEGWVDEQLAFHQADYKFRGSKDTGINVKSFWFDVYYGGNATAPGSISFDFDSLVLADSRVGCGDFDAATFRDTASSVHYANIEKLALADITRGCNPPLNDLYCPEQAVTRGQMAAFLDRALGLPGSAQDWFRDDDGSVFEADINALAAAGITKGCSQTGYCPNRFVTRGEMAAFLDRALDLPAAPADRFDDDDTSIFEASIDRLAAAGITAGCNPPDNTNFCPYANVTRAQMASFLSRALDLPSPPPPAAGYTPPEVPAGYDAVVPAGWSIQAVANSQPPGAKILVEAGTHLRQSVVPKSGQTFIGEDGAVMDGLNELQYAFTGNAANVTISNIEIRNYTTGLNEGAIHATGSGWTISDCEVHHNTHAGISIVGASTISNCYVHHNEEVGIVVNGGSGAVLDGNEVSYNNYDSSTGDYFAGVKLIGTQDAIVRGNFVHHNSGYGLWTYRDNIRTTYRDNVIEDNYWAGISHDHSYTVTIDSNEFRRNGSKAPVDTNGALNFYNGAIQITGPNATVTDNVIEGNHNAVVVVGFYLDTAEGRYGALTPINTTVTGNTIIDSGNTGLVTNGTDLVFTTAIFDYNDYRFTDPGGLYWVWSTGAPRGFDGWRADGNDAHGSVATP
jgi:parallel beta-helix repeat protein